MRISDDETATTRFWWIRHAPVPHAAAEGRIYGDLDLPSEVTDAAAARGLAQRLPAEAQTYCSSLMRTHQTAQAVREAGGAIDEMASLHDLREQHLGDWQGRTHADLAQAEPDALAAFWADPAVRRPPGGESFGDLIARVGPVLDQLVARHPGEDVVIFAHGGTIRAACALALDLPPAGALRLVIDNWSLTRLEHLASVRGQAAPGWRVAAINQDPRVG